MPTPAKRTQRARRNSRREASIDRPDDSSPSRPSKRRKQATESSDVPEEEGSSLAADSSIVKMSDENGIVSRVAQHLIAPKDQVVQASKDHSNSLHESNAAGVQAYAKIAAQDWTFYVTQLNINIGRTSEPAPVYPPGYDFDSDEDYVHIDLGPSKMVSRQHVSISFKDGAWMLDVKGRNGVKVNGTPVKCKQTRAMGSGEVLEIGGVEMMFVLPLEMNPLKVDSVYLQRAGISPSDLPEPTQAQSTRSLRPITSGDQLPPSAGRTQQPRGQTFPQPIAPAPPDYKRPGTPPSARSRAFATQKSPAYKDAGTMLVNPSDVDYSQDDSKHIKPNFSYAQLITQAIINTPDGKLNLSGIYSFIMDNYSYYRHQQAAGWQNSIRHNLSLNKAFEKVARSSEEPGKGMKWYILPELREDLCRSAYRGGRGGHRGSSNPSSPNQLNYVNQGVRDMAARDQSSARKRKVSPSGSPQPRSSLRESHLTPDRAARRLLPEEPPSTADGSPLPRYRKITSSTQTKPPEPAPRSPTLTSSYLPEDGGAFVTPAPHRVQVKLAPPSTLQRPSQHMPTSSPAPFWRYADVGSTPLKAVQYDLSPIRPRKTVPASSSPPAPANKSPGASPIRNVRIEARESTVEAAAAEEPEEEEGFDLTKGFRAIGTYHHLPRMNGYPKPVNHGGPNGDRRM